MLKIPKYYSMPNAVPTANPSLEALYSQICQQLADDTNKVESYVHVHFAFPLSVQDWPNYFFFHPYRDRRYFVHVKVVETIDHYTLDVNEQNYDRIC